MDNTCEICKKSVRCHEKMALCNLCNKYTHLRCLPTYNVSDNEYATANHGHWTCTYCLANIFPFFNIEENNNLIHEINEISRQTHDIDHLNSLIFHPFELNDTDDYNDLDPDQNYYNPIMNQRLLACKYYHPDQLATDLHSKEKIQLSIFCMNIRSLRKNVTGLNTLLDIIDSDFQILYFTETWL